MRVPGKAQQFGAVQRTIVWICIIAVLGSGSVSAQVQALPDGSAPVVDTQAAATPVTLLVGHSSVINVDGPITRVSLTSADVADALVTTPQQLLVNGKAPGTISMFVWPRSGAVRRYEITVHRDLRTLERQLAELFPGEGIQAQSNGRHIVLSGNASRKDVAERAIDVAAGFVAKREEVVSLLRVQDAPRTSQVLLRVRFAEVSRSALTELGVSLFTGPTGINNTLGRVTTQQFSAPSFDELNWSKESGDFGGPVTEASGKFTFSDFLNFFILSERYDLGMLVRALQTRGLFQSLAEPNLVAESGSEASFLAGGEFPIPVAQGSGANIGVSVMFKEFGVRLSFTPTVNGDRVHLKVRPEVSMLDFNNAVTLAGFRIPALTTRRTETAIELRDGQTFAIAGLMNNSMTQTLQKIPGIGDIPILGYLFRSKAARKDQTELVVIITPQILPAGSPGVTASLPRIQEPFLPALQERDSIPMPPPAFVEPPRAPGATMAVPAADPALPSRRVTAVDRKALEKSLARDAEQARRDAEQARRDAKAEQKRQEQLAREQAKRDAEAAKRAAEAAKREADAAERDAEAARKEAERERKRQAEIDVATSEMKAAYAAYEAQLAAQRAKR